MLKEQVLSVVGGTCHYLNQPNCPIEGNNACELCDKQVEYIINLFKAEVDKLTVIDSWAEYDKFCKDGLSGGISLVEYLLDKQLQHSKKQLLEGLE